MLFEHWSKLEMILAEMMGKIRINKVVGHMKEQMIVPSIFHCHSRHYEESMTEVEKISTFIFHI
jgi:hypothetical protein